MFATVLWPTQGALGRRTFFASDEADLKARVYWAELSPLVVPSARALTLRTRLQHEHDAGRADAVTRPDLGWTFVPYDRSYWFAQNCADIAAEWFTELDCSVSWVPIRTGLAVEK